MAKSASFVATVQFPTIVDFDPKMLDCQISVVCVNEVVGILSSRELSMVYY